MFIIVSVLAFLFLVFLYARIYFAFQFRKQVRKLFSGSIANSDKTFTQEQISGLPEPVQRYFRYALKDGQPYVSYIRMTHDGQFKTGLKNPWVNITGEQYATTATPGFIWKGKTSMFVARDLYIEDRGRLMVSLFSSLKIVDGHGEEFNQGELLRWLSESVLYPTNFLPSERLRWEAIDSEKAKLIFNYKSLTLFLIVNFNKVGEIVQIETKRYMDKKNLETWIIRLWDYKKMNEMMIPAEFEVLWRLKDGDLSYAKFHLKKIEYDMPEKF